MSLAFAHLNLRHNPFGELTETERAALAVVDIDDAVEWLRTPRRVVQIIGDSGRGKTTHLIAFRARFPGVPLVRVRDGEPPEIPEACDPLVIDEVQFLSGRLRQRLWRRDGSFVLGTHDDLTDELVRARLEVRTIRPADRMTLERLRRALSRRIEAARRGAGPVPAIPTSSLASLRARHGTDVRAIEQELYERFQTLPEVTDVEV